MTRRPALGLDGWPVTAAPCAPSQAGVDFDCTHRAVKRLIPHTTLRSSCVGPASVIVLHRRYPHLARLQCTSFPSASTAQLRQNLLHLAWEL